MRGNYWEDSLQANEDKSQVRVISELNKDYDTPVIRASPVVWQGLNGLFVVSVSGGLSCRTTDHLSGMSHREISAAVRFISLHWDNSKEFV